MRGLTHEEMEETQFEGVPPRPFLRLDSGYSLALVPICDQIYGCVSQFSGYSYPIILCLSAVPGTERATDADDNTGRHLHADGDAFPHDHAHAVHHGPADDHLQRDPDDTPRRAA